MANSVRAQIAKWQSAITSKGSEALVNIKSIFTGIQQDAAAVVASAFDGDIIGINAEKIPAMKQEIQDYVSAIDTALDEVVTNAAPSQAFADKDMQDACNAFLQAIMDACKAYTSNLLKFYDTLSEVHSKYVENQATMASNLKEDQSTNMRSSVETYTSQAS